MKSKLLRTIGALALTSAISLQPSAFVSASPLGTAFTYQGRLNDGANPANGIYDIQFTLYDALTVGSVVGGPLTSSATGVTNGLFTVALDFGAAAFDGSARWLEIGVHINGSGGGFTTLSPRQPLTPAPYALRAANYSGAVAASQITGTLAASNIGAGTITSSNLAAGSVTSAQLAAGSVTTSTLADGAVTLRKLPSAVAGSSLSITFTNPTPAAADYFGTAVAAVGTDKVLIGALYKYIGGFDAGAAYLFSTNGTLLTMFTNPTPANGDYFGNAVAAVGLDKVLIGAYQDYNGAIHSGAAYLFNTNGALLTTFTNPTPADSDYFGYAVAAVGTDKVVIGAYQDDTGAYNAGAAYLFSTNGALLTTFTNPTPADSDFFGCAVAAVGTDQVLIGAFNEYISALDGGAAYLFSTNGTLLTTFTKPTPAAGDSFGWAVAAVGTDKVVVGTMNDDTGAASAGAAYLFSTNGALLTIFTNPTPAISDKFGNVVAAVGTDKVLIGAYWDDAGANNAGAAYLFSTNGTLLATFSNPTPADGDWFGYAVAAVGTDKVLIGACFDDTGATDAGAAYLFSLDSYVPGLISAGVVDHSINAADLDPSIGVWSKSGTNVYYNGGNVGIGTSNPTNKLHVLGGATFSSGSAGANQNVVWTPGSASWSFTSDRNTKEQLVPVNQREVLDKVCELPISEWNYIGYDQRHIGPMAQDFHAAFGLNRSDTSLNDADLHGVALAAIQGLNGKVESGKQKAESRIERLEAENAELKRRLEALERLVRTQRTDGGGR